VVERKGDTVIIMDIPAIDPAEVNITILDDKLTVEGERKREKEFLEAEYYRSERVQGSS
jgi:HSP20 family protein